ncbi:hypothetical protein T484DRAFT_2123310 [Baffinella frigidus]|nr:hypothetical protein T484DRAFT_2123310 [Cryptophyta sp. CCMP2293]
MKLPAMSRPAGERQIAQKMAQLRDRGLREVQQRQQQLLSMETEYGIRSPSGSPLAAVGGRRGGGEGDAGDQSRARRGSSGMVEGALPMRCPGTRSRLTFADPNERSPRVATGAGMSPDQTRSRRSKRGSTSYSSARTWAPSDVPEQSRTIQNDPERSTWASPVTRELAKEECEVSRLRRSRPAVKSSACSHLDVHDHLCGFSSRPVRDPLPVRREHARVRLHAPQSYHAHTKPPPPRTLQAYRGTSLIKNRPPLGPYSRTMPRVLGWS